jgi:4-amino-4-deoxychorismate lyase
LLIDGAPGQFVPADDRGLCYGDGLFETIAWDGRRPLLWSRHMERLADGCRRLQLAAPDPRLLYGEVESVSKPHPGVVKLIVTRGGGARGYRSPPAAEPRRIVAIHAWPDHGNRATQGIRVVWCRTRLALNPTLAGIKHLNRLEQVMARREWTDDSIAEGLMCDYQDRVVEGTMSNVFVVHQNEVITPGLNECGVAGVMRAALLALLEELGYKTRIESLSREQLIDAEEVFLTNSIIGLWPVVELDGKHWTIGPVSRRLLRELKPRGLHPCRLAA